MNYIQERKKNAIYKVNNLHDKRVGWFPVSNETIVGKDQKLI
jgi:hypothetical protein